jgi:hypothetical protein
MIDINAIRPLVSDETIVLTNHLLTRMRQRGITYDTLKSTLQNGEIIEQYEEDFPFPSCLINYNNVHIVCSISDRLLYIITAYHPSPEKWENNGKTRRTNP